MKLFLKIVAFFSALLFLLGGTTESVIGFTDGDPIIAEKVDYCFNDDKLLIGAYYGDIDHVEEAAEAGIEFFIEGSVDDAFLDKCAENGIGVIAAGYNLPSAYGTLSDGCRDAWVNFDYSKYKDHPALWGDDMIDEPGAYSYDNIAAALNAYYANTDGKLALVNLFPEYANNDQLQEYPETDSRRDFWLSTSNNGVENGVSYKMYVSDYINKLPVDYICMDFYPYNSKQNAFGKEVKATNEYWLPNLDILAEACRETNRDLWVITQAAGETEKGDPDGNHPRWCDEVSDISQQAYASLAFGAKAIIHAEFSAKGWWDPEHSHMIDIDGNTTATYDAVKEVDGYLAYFADEYGQYKYESTYMINPVKVAGKRSSKLAVTVPGEAIDLVTSNGLLVGTFSGEDGKAYVITNMEELNNSVSAYFEYIVPHGTTITVYKQGKKFLYNSGSLVSVTLEPGEGVFVTTTGTAGPIC